MKKLGILLVASVLVLSVLLSGCFADKQSTTSTDDTSKPSSETKAETTQEPKEKVTLSMLVYENHYKYVTDQNSIADAYAKDMPNVTIEPQQVKDSGQLEQILKIRNSAEELPDIMVLKPYMLTQFADSLASLNDTTAAKENKFANGYAVEGKVVGIPENAVNEYIYYRKSIFEEYNLEIPTTWDEFINTAKVIKDGGKYIPIGLGAKDAWADYPYNEFMPLVEAKSGTLWNEMAAMDEPFSPGQPFYEAYVKIQKLYDADVLGEDPLGISFDQIKVKFYVKEVAMMAAGQWFLPGCSEDIDDVNDLGVFLLPVRNTKEEPFYATVMADAFYATPENGSKLEASKEFIDWYFTSDYYFDYLTDQKLGSTVDSIKIDLPLFNEALDRQKLEYVLYDGGNKDYNDIANSFGFDVKRLGQEMIAGKDFNEMMSTLNKNWKEARESLGK